MHMQRPARQIEAFQRLLRSSRLQHRSRIMPAVFEHLREGFLATAQYEERLGISLPQSTIAQSYGASIGIRPARRLNREIRVVDIHHRNGTGRPSIRRTL